MCKYCKPLFEVESGCYKRATAKSKKIMKFGDADISINIGLDTGNFGKNHERQVCAFASLTSGGVVDDALVDGAVARGQIKFCPFCGTKLDIQTP